MTETIDHRPSWDEYFMKLANEVATRTTCMRRGVGAVIVKDRRILATGYNGVPTGMRHCAETGCLRQQLGVPSGQRHEICRGLHAEQNVIIQAAVPANAGEELDDLMNRIHPLEHRIYPQALQWLAEGRLRVEGRQVFLAPADRKTVTPDGPWLVWPPLEEGF